MTIISIGEEHLAGFRAAVGSVARERRYLAHRGRGIGRAKRLYLHG